MTTIAYRDGVLVTDSRSTAGTYLDNDNTKKLFKLPDRSVIGMSGDWTPGMKLYDAVVEAIREGGPLPVGIKRCHAIMMRPTGKVLFYEDNRWWDLKEWKYPYYAIGSGRMFAVAAMDMGATAIDAVNVAKKRDIHTGGRLQIAYVEKL